MINSTYLYSFLIFIAFSFIFYLLVNFRPSKSEMSNKLLLKNLLEGFDLELPEELKALETPSNESKKYHNY
tara:strand:+ start:171 stop:383 length:213 start_codon:yes stop_codon:yes gene_type:complete